MKKPLYEIIFVTWFHHIMLYTIIAYYGLKVYSNIILNKEQCTAFK